MSQASGARALLRELFGIDLRSLAAFRIAVAGLVLVDLALRAPFLAASYSDAGVWPREAVGETGPLFALYLIGGSTHAAAILFGAAAAFASLLLVGFQTRLAAIASWLLLASLQQRQIHFLDGGDLLLRALLFWGIFLPLGAHLSLDARGRPPPRSPSVASPASAALVLQFVFLYCFAGLLKSGPEWSSEGSAIELALQLEPWRTSFGETLLQYPELLRRLTPLTRWFEILAPLAVFAPVWTGPVRTAVVAAFCALQLGFGLAFDLHLLPWISAAAGLPLLPAWFWEKLGVRAAAETLPGPEPRSALSRLPQGIVCALLLYAFAANLHSVGAVEIPRRLRSWGAMLGIQQSWTLFAPSPNKFNASFEAFGRIAEDRAVDLMHAEHGAGWEPTRRFQQFYRLRYHLERMVRPPKPEPHARYYLRWLCRRWNAARPDDERIDRARLLVTQEFLTQPSPPSHRVLLREVPCPGAP